MAAGVIRNHPFIDGNKRVAFFATDVFLRLNGWYIEVDAVDDTDPYDDNNDCTDDLCTSGSPHNRSTPWVDTGCKASRRRPPTS